VRLETKSRKPKTRQTEDVILFSCSGMKFAMPAASVDEIRNLDGLTAFNAGQFNPKLAKVKSLLTREKKDRDKTYFVVDASQLFRIKPAKVGRVMVLRDSKAALAVERIDRMTQIASVISMPLAFSGQEREWYRGLALIHEIVVPLINPEAILSAGDVAVLDAMLAKSNAASEKLEAKGAVSA
jgi:chemotaxis signal transduction protein